MPPIAQVPCSLFGGLDTEIAPPDLPEGVSPGNQDVAYLPGSVFSRPGLHKIYDGSVGLTYTYEKEYITPTGAPLNLLLASTGALYWEDPVNAPGVLNGPIAQVTPGSRARSVTAFGREYIAFSDGLHGQDVPLQVVANADGTLSIYRVSQDGPGAAPTVTSRILAASAISSIVRANNLVTVTTSAAHNLQQGYQALISGVPAAAIGAGISSIVIDNEDFSGIATVTTAAPHGLTPGLNVTITGVLPVVVGGTIASIQREGGIVNVSTTGAHGLFPGASVTLSGVSVGSFNVSAVVDGVSASFRFSFAQNDTTDVVSSGGTVSVNWPIPDTNTPTYFQVIEAPTATTFQVSLNYADSTWTTGSVGVPWDGTYYVNSIGSATIFTYQQYGPAATGSSGTVTPYGQAAPGIHQIKVAFLTSQGYLTRFSPPITFIANGGQFLSISNLPVGPSNVIARVLAFTGAGGAAFFYLPISAQANGQAISTVTQINDNVATTAVLDFSDNSLFAATAIDIPGNNLPAQVVLGPALGVTSSASRLFWWGDRNKVENLLNMGFDGGYLPTAPTLSAGWTTVGDPGGALMVVGGFRPPGFAWNIAVSAGGARYGTIYQSAYQDYLGVPIVSPNATYRVRAWLKPNAADAGLNVIFFLESAIAGFHSQVVFNGAAMSTAGGWVEGNLALPVPVSPIPIDMVFALTATSTTNPVNVTIDDAFLVNAQSPYNLAAHTSYVINPEAFDGETGIIGPQGDDSPILNMFTIRKTIYIQTADQLHETTDSPAGEPSSWETSPVTSQDGATGIIGPFGYDTGETWAVWASPSGLRGFAGSEPGKLSQEIQTLWDSINPLAWSAVWVKNDPVFRRIYVGVPTGSNTACNQMFVLDYRENDQMSQILGASPVRISFTGRMISSDLGRKWTVWNLPVAAAATLLHAGKSKVHFAGIGYGNVYYLDPAKLTDDDFGQMFPYYITYGFVGHDQEQQLQVGTERKLYKTFNVFASGTGQLQITPLVDSLENARSARPLQTLQLQPTRDLSWGLNVSGERVFVKIAVLPIAPTRTDVQMNVQKIIMRMMEHPVSPGRSAI